ncbi:MAG: nuclear transport factor 2 family protein [Bacteroidales bacterium]
MKTNLFKPSLRYLAIMLMVPVLLQTGCSTSEKQFSTLRSSIENINSSFEEAFRSGNIENLSEFYTSDAQLMFPGAPAITGVDQIMAYWQGAVNAGVSNVRLQTTDVSGSANEVIEYGAYTIFAGDNITVDKGKYIVIWKKEGEKLKVFRDISNSDNPPPIARAVENDTIMIIHNYIRADKVEDFRKFSYDLIRIALKENSPSSRSARMLEPLTANDDGTYTYIYLMDPVISTPGAYAFLPPLAREYGEEKAREIIKFGFSDALVRPQVSNRYVVRVMGK